MILTSRGYSLPPKSFHYDRRLVNQGFTDQQVQQYIQQYFSSLPKPDEKLAKTVQQLVQQNQGLQSQVHNPLILALACDFYRDSSENGKTDLQQLQLLDLYDHNFKTFIRRYLDAQSKYLKKPDLAWAETQESSLSDLLALCPVEVEFLQTLSFMGIEHGVQRFDRSTKEKALEKVREKYPKASTAPFLNALKLGFLHEFPGPQTSSLHKVHEFAHLTFQEYLAARHIALGLQRNQKNAYSWLRANKYNPAYREVLNFICAMMQPKRYPVFWKILLEESSDLSGTGHLQLLLFSLQAANSAMKDIPSLKNHLMCIERHLLSDVEKGKFIYTTWLQTTLNHCPQIVSALSDDFWNKLIVLLKPRRDEMCESAWQLCQALIPHIGQLNISRREQLFTMLLCAACDKKSVDVWSVRQAAVEALKIYMQQVVHYSAEERSRLLAALLLAVGAENWWVREAAIQALRACAQQSAHYSAKERSRLLAALLRAANDKDITDVGHPAVQALRVCAQQGVHYSAEERNQLFAALLRAAGERNERVLQASVRALRVCAQQVAYYSAEERSRLFDKLLFATNNKNEWVQRAAIQALGVCARQSAHYSAKERSQLLDRLLCAAGDGNELVWKVTTEVLKTFVQQWAHYATEERSRLFAVLLRVADNKYGWKWKAAVVTLGVCAQQSGHLFSGRT